MKKCGKKAFAGIMAALTLLLAMPEFSLQSARATSVESVPESATVGKTLYENDFTGTTLADWTTDGVGTGWLWNVDTGTAVLDDAKDGVRIQASSGSKAVALPVLDDVTDFVYSATVKVLGDGGSFGLLTELDNPATEASGATHFGVYVDNATNYGVYRYTKVADSYYNENYENPMRILGYDVSAGDTCTLTVYNILGTAYFYIDGAFVSSSEAYFDTADYNGVGLYAYGADILVTGVSVKELKGVTEAFSIADATVRYADEEGYTQGKKSVGLRFVASIDKGSETYQANVSSGTFDPSSQDVQFGMLLLPTDLIPENGALSKDTPMALDVPMEKILTQTDSQLTFAVSLLDIPQEQFSRDYTARVYMKVKKGETWEYIYAKNAKTRSFVSVGNTYYEDVKDEAVRARLDKIFEKCVGYYGKNASRITFSLFADFHYLENTYMSAVADINTIIKEAKTNKADFVLHLGDFCNNYTASPEIIKAYVQNKADMPVYGIYGNHELEGNSDTMALVTPSLTNRKDQVVWGTTDGKIGDGSVGYYYFDVNGIRIICLDTNYGWHKENQEWVHREDQTFDTYGKDTYGKNKVTDENAFGVQQRSWLKKVLDDAAARNISCIVTSHHDTSGKRAQTAPDAEAVRQIFKEANEKRAGTVLLVMNGHLHTDAFHVVDDILYFDVNTVRNGSYSSEYTTHYPDDVTFTKVTYDVEGNEDKKVLMPVNGLKGEDVTYFYTDPLRTFVTVSSSGRIEIEGMETTWLSGLEPPASSPYMHPWISGGVFDMPVD